MHGWKLTLGLCGVALGAALLAPRLFPALRGLPVEPAPEPPVLAQIPAVDPAEMPVTPEVTEPPRTIDLVVALDTSGSMDRLIDSTRARLWDIVNEVDARDPEATLRVALVTYGSPSYGAENDYVKVQLDLTEDLDAVYARAWELQTDGGDEYVGSVIQRTVAGLSWAPSDDPDNRRLLFVAGNETAALGPVPFQLAARQAASNGVIVNTLFAGSRSAGDSLRWDEVAEAGRGRFMAIDAELSAVAVQTPYDRQLEALNRDLNRTYVQYNAEGQRKLDQIVKNDEAASSLGMGSLASRVGTKGSDKHKVDSWDLVSGLARGSVDFDDVDQEALPGDLQGLDATLLAKAVEEKRAKRANVKAEIEEVQKKRAAHLREAAQKDSGAGLDEAMSEALAEQL